uniref:XK-related protein n=1 Tax=Loa loa TaxID=7209 RepID=A0A1I7VAX8_LOALO
MAKEYCVTYVGMSFNTLLKWDGFKSRWDVFRSHSHEYHLDNQLAPWMVNTLQSLKFLIFVVSHLFLIFGAAISKLIVILLATSTELKTLESYFEKKCHIGEGKVKNTEVIASAVCTLWLIQNVPDVMAIIQSLYRIYKYPKEREGAALVLFIMECCRSIGMAILFYHIFPSLDPLHCLILSVSAVFIPLYLKIDELIRRSFDPIWRRFSVPLFTVEVWNTENEFNDTTHGINIAHIDFEFNLMDCQTPIFAI